jgi:hypothetical protein
MIALGSYVKGGLNTLLTDEPAFEGLTRDGSGNFAVVNVTYAALPATPLDCDDGNLCTQDSCTAASGCISTDTPATGCITGTGASLQVKDNSDDTKDQLKWKLPKGGLVVQADLGEPITTRTYVLCIYDETASVPSLQASLQIAPGVSWTSKDPKGFSYADKAGTSDGVTKALLKTGAAGKSLASVSAKGVNIPTFAPLSATELFDQHTKVIVQLVNDQTSQCWSSEFTAAKKNTAEQFQAKAP